MIVMIFNNIANLKALNTEWLVPLMSHSFTVRSVLTNQLTSLLVCDKTLDKGCIINC